MPMKFQINLPGHIYTNLCLLAIKEHRPPHYQVEAIVEKAIKQAIDAGVAIPVGAHGEIRIPCPQCSPSRRKSHVPCLAVNADTGTWFCHHCEWRGALAGGQEPSPLPALSRQPAQSDEQKRSALRRT